MEGGKAYAITCPLLTKSDGSKFGKSEGGNIWLDAERTSPYKFYQYWLNTSDEDAEKYIKIFTFIDQPGIERIVAEHRTAPHTRTLQKRLAEEITRLVHSAEALENAQLASEILFEKSSTEDLKKLTEAQFLEIFEGVPQASISKSELVGLSIVDALVAKSQFLKSNGEARKELAGNAVSVNKEKVTEQFSFSENNLIQGRYILIGKGKKNNYVLKVE